MLDAREIIKRIPHRFPFLLIDRVIELVPGQSGVGIKCVTINEPYFQGHFPEYPIVPGVLIIESLAQLAAVVFASAAEREGEDTLEGEPRKMDRPGYLAQVNMRYREPVKPGDVLKLEISLIRRMGNVCRVNAVATVDEKIVAQGELTFA